MHNYDSSACTITICLHAKSQYLCMPARKQHSCMLLASHIQELGYHADMLLLCRYVVIMHFSETKLTMHAGILSSCTTLQSALWSYHFCMHGDDISVWRQVYACITTAPLHNHNMRCSEALFNPETALLIQKRHPYAEDLNSATSGTVKRRFYIVEMF